MKSVLVVSENELDNQDKVKIWDTIEKKIAIKNPLLFYKKNFEEYIY